MLMDNKIANLILNLYFIVTGALGDILSYIRLFALGVSSAILGFVVNQIAAQLKAVPGIGPVLFILLLIIGHTGNLALAGLSAFVHTLRLSFVEFYNNVGFNGGGEVFQPFRKKQKEFNSR